MNEQYDYGNNLEDFINDVCIVMAGKVRITNKWSSPPEENMIYLSAKSRLIQRGTTLLRKRAAKLKLENMKQEYADTKNVFIQDGLIEGDQ
jgi:hypothetical protein